MVRAQAEVVNNGRMIGKEDRPRMTVAGCGEKQQQDGHKKERRDGKMENNDKVTPKQREYLAVTSDAHAAGLLKVGQHFRDGDRTELAQVTDRNQDSRVQLSNINRLCLLASTVQVLQRPRSR